MSALGFNLNLVVALCVALAVPASAGAQGDGRLDDLYDALKTAPKAEAERLGREILMKTSRSGSPAMNLLLKRGRDAMDHGDTNLAIELLSALTDHAPEFAEGWHARSVAFAYAGQIGPAMMDLERALTLDPRSFTAIYSLAGLLEEIDRPGLAYDAYLRVSAIHPHFDDVPAALERLEGAVKGSDL